MAMNWIWCLSNIVDISIQINFNRISLTQQIIVRLQDINILHSCDRKNCQLFVGQPVSAKLRKAMTAAIAAFSIHVTVAFALAAMVTAAMAAFDAWFSQTPVNCWLDDDYTTRRDHNCNDHKCRRLDDCSDSQSLPNRRNHSIIDRVHNTRWVKLLCPIINFRSIDGLRRLVYNEENPVVVQLAG